VDTVALYANRLDEEAAALESDVSRFQFQ